MRISTSTIVATLAIPIITASAKSVPFAPSSDPGVYPGGNENPPSGWSTLPDIDGARIDNSTLRVGSGSATLLHYIDASYNASNIKRAVIQIHGENRDAWNQWIYSDLAAKRAATGGSFDRDEVVVMAPMFFRTVDEGAYPFDPNQDSGNKVTATIDTAATSSARQGYVQPSGFAATPSPLLEGRSFKRRGKFPVPLQKVSTTQVMIWKATEWGEGAEAYEPADADGAGSFDALDAAVDFFLDKTRFPQLQKVVVAGFSLGAQLTNRYATFRDDTSEDDRIIYWISSPNSFVYLQAGRPRKIGSSCIDTYGDYKYGLNGTLPRYVTRSDNELSTSSLISRYLGRTVYYLVGLRDKSAGLDSCAPNSQGLGHLDKMYYWTQQIVPNLPGSTGVDGQLPDNNLMRYVEDTGHQDWKIITSDPGVETLWLKQWYANGTDANAPQSGGTVAGQTPSSKTIAGISNGATAIGGKGTAVVSAALVALLVGVVL
ncbi:hypothetical protein PHBOTO_000351 [Pseudozyma hubeiensis]|nr:hypothetical protein PHBOTO_000351 [Pseudozyma hubeiensis]